MDLRDLTEEQLKEVKNRLIEKEMIFERKKVYYFDAKFFEMVTISNFLIKFFLFISMGIYIVINLVGIIISCINNTLNNPLGNIIGLFAICFIVFAIFSNINTNKKKEENALFIKDDNFIFNFNDGVGETPNLFYSLPYDSIRKIEFIICSQKNGQTLGGVTFAFSILGYEVYHIIRFTNLSKIENYIRSHFPTLISSIIIDGKLEKGYEPVKSKQKLKYNLISLAILFFSLLLAVIPPALNYHSIALIISAIILFITAILVFLSNFLYTYHLVQGIMISSVFLIIGFLVPLLIIEISGSSIFDFITKDSEILLPTFFGIIGICLYAYNIIIILGKIIYKMKKNRTF